MCSATSSPNNETRGCKKFTIEYNSHIGRHLLATQDINPGEIIIDEPAIVRGPCVDFNHRNKKSGQIQQSKLPCCICFRGFDFDSIRCSYCDCYLFCSKECSQSSIHTEHECKILNLVKSATSPLSIETYCNVITTIRCLLVRRKNSFQWLQICKLQSKVEELENSKAFTQLDAVFAKLNWNLFGVIGNEDAEGANDTKLISAARHCYGVMRMNAYSSLNHYVGFEGLYFLTSLMSHSCIMNTDRHFDMQNEGQLIVKAAVKIKPGDIITTTYLSLMSNTEQRNQDMQSNWLFICSCVRCKDPTELGTFLSTTLSGQIDTQIEDVGIQDCKISYSRIKESLPQDFTDVATLENWLEEFDTGIYLHTNHSIFSQVKLFLSLYYGRETGGIKTLTNDQLLRKFQLSCEILEIFEVIYPGIYQCKGELLFEAWTAVRELNARGIHFNCAENISESSLVFRAHEILYHSIIGSSFHHMREILEDEYPELRFPETKLDGDISDDITKI